MFVVGLALLVSVTVNVALIMRYVYVRDTRMRRFVVNSSLVAFAILFSLAALEFGFRQVIISDGFVITLAGRKWLDTYYKPINSLGYRDDDHDADVAGGKKFLLVAGDSFVAGHGINDYRDRFSNLVGDALGDAWSVGIAAQGGWGTEREFRAIESYPLKPDVLVVSYYINDIDDATAKLDRLPDFYPPPVWAPIRPFVNRSYLLNFVYWRFVRGTIGMGQNYWDHVQTAYNDPQIWDVHAGELQAIIDYTRENDIGLLFVLFPHLVFLEESSAFTAKVEDFLTREGVPVVNMGDRLAGRPWQDLIVNSIDTHPNKEVQREIAADVFDALKANGLIDHQ